MWRSELDEIFSRNPNLEQLKSLDGKSMLENMRSEARLCAPRMMITDMFDDLTRAHASQSDFTNLACKSEV